MSYQLLALFFYTDVFINIWYPDNIYYGNDYGKLLNYKIFTPYIYKRDRITMTKL